jgi:hypothetical protein
MICLLGLAFNSNDPAWILPSSEIGTVIVATASPNWTASTTTGDFGYTFHHFFTNDEITRVDVVMVN